MGAGRGSCRSRAPGLGERPVGFEVSELLPGPDHGEALRKVRAEDEVIQQG